MTLTYSRSPEVAAHICERTAEGWTLRQIARELGCSHGSIIFWRLDDAVFADQYARAKTAQLEAMAEDLAQIADDGTNDWQDRELESGAIIQVPDHEHIHRSKLRVDTRKWLLAKLMPKKYGDRVAVDATVRNVPTDQLTDDELARIAISGGSGAAETEEM